MKIVENSHRHVRFDRALPPVLRVVPGEEVAFDTLDACYGLVHNVAELRAYRQQPSRGGDPLTGPVFIEGAAPGDTLIVEILRIEQTRPGFQLIGPNRGIVHEEIPDLTCYEVQPKGRTFSLPNGMELPADPVIGTFGNAPAGEPINHPNPLGGNCDIPQVCVGARLHLPIETPGALFSLGDVHACQGDGEVVGAPEVSARVTVRFRLEPGRRSDWFMIENATHWYSAWAAETEAESARQATFQNGRFLARLHGIEFKDALILLTMIGQISISRTGIWGMNSVVCAGFSKERAQEALRNYRRKR